MLTTIGTAVAVPVSLLLTLIGTAIGVWQSSQDSDRRLKNLVRIVFSFLALVLVVATGLVAYHGHEVIQQAIDDFFVHECEAGLLVSPGDQCTHDVLGRFSVSDDGVASYPYALNGRGDTVIKTDPVLAGRVFGFHARVDRSEPGSWRILMAGPGNPWVSVMLEIPWGLVNCVHGSDHNSESML